MARTGPRGGRAHVAVLANDGRVHPFAFWPVGFEDVPAEFGGAPDEFGVDFGVVLGGEAEVEGVAGLFFDVFQARAGAGEGVGVAEDGVDFSLEVCAEASCCVSFVYYLGWRG